MSTKISSSLVGVFAVWALPVLALAQFPSELVGFNDNPDVETSREMFRIPEFSGTTRGFILVNSAGQFNNNNAFRATGLHTEGAAGLQVFFNWADNSDPDAWVRLTTFNGAIRPNPALDTRGKVRFKLTNQSEIFFGEVGVCLGIRETGGVGIAQLADAGNSGPIEWVGVDTTINGIIAGADGIVDTAAAGDDVQEFPIGFDVIAGGLPSGTAVISAGGNGVIDTTPAGGDEDRFGYVIGADGARVPIPAITLPPSASPYVLEWDLATGVVTLDGVPQTSGITGFTGNGTLADSPDNRGTLEHVAITNLASDTATLIEFAIDELQFEATVPDPTPPPTIVTPVVDIDTQVRVQTIAAATVAELFINDVSQGTRAPVNQTATFSGLTLQVGDVLTATQTANGVVSALSPPVLVFAQGVVMADNFDSYASEADLEALWTPSITTPNPPEAKVRLQAGGGASCPNFLREDSPPNANAARLYRNIGGVDGSDVDPLVVAWHFRYTGQELAAGARTRFELAHFNGAGFNTGPRGEGTAGITIFNQISGRLFDEYNLALRVTDNVALRDELIANGWTAAAGFLHFPSGVLKQPGVWHKMEIEVRATVINFFIDGVLRNPTPYEAGIPRPNATPYDFVIIGEGFSNNGPLMTYDNVAVTQGAAFPFGDPVTPAPTITGPLFPDGALVSIRDIDPNATDVTVFSNGAQIGSATGAFPGGTADIAVSPNFVNGAAISATQLVGGLESCPSIPVTVAVTPVTIADAVLVPGQTSIQIADVEEGLASNVSVFSNDSTIIGSLNNPTTDPTSVTVTPLVLGASVTADQTIAGVEGPQSAAVVVAVPAPLLVGPLTVSDTIVAVDGLHPLATDATVYVNGAAAGTIATGGAAAVNVTLNSSLFINDEVTATQTIDAIEGPFSNTISVEVPMCTRVFLDTFDTDTSASWNVIVVDNGGENDAFATFAFDYGAVGIPPSPNGNGSTLGLKMEANPGGAGASASVTVSPIGQSFVAADGYRLTFDAWVNANGPFPAGGTGSTQFLTAGAGYDDATGNLGGTSGSGAWYAISGESGSSRDVRAYKDVEEQFPESGQYAAGMQNGVANNTNNDQFYFDLFGTPAPPAAQTALFPNQTGDLLTGSAGFAWHEVTVTVLGTKARWEINGVTVVTIDATIGNPFSGLDGNVSLGLMDVFSSISDNPEMSFGLVDNVKIFIAGALTGDIDGDDQVGLSDLAVQLANFGRTGDATFTDGDLDGDQDVDLADLAVMLAAFGNVCR